jgi:hypothetical protein
MELSLKKFPTLRFLSVILYPHPVILRSGLSSATSSAAAVYCLEEETCQDFLIQALGLNSGACLHHDPLPAHKAHVSAFCQLQDNISALASSFGRNIPSITPNLPHLPNLPELNLPHLPTLRAAANAPASAATVSLSP